jgi:hypothetical protein
LAVVWIEDREEGKERQKYNSKLRGIVFSSQGDNSQSGKLFMDTHQYTFRAGTDLRMGARCFGGECDIAVSFLYPV